MTHVNDCLYVSQTGASVYSMTKGAVASLVRGIAIDLAPRGITVNNVQPGPTETDMTAAVAEMVKPLVPLGRLGKPEEIAGLVAYLARPEAGFITGSSQTIDGGYVAAAKREGVESETKPPVVETLRTQEGGDSQPSKAGDTASSAPELAKSSMSDATIGGSRDESGVSKSKAGSDAAEEYVTLPI
jgi:Enoyl-(Acyl carrier protein) reductase